MKRPTLIEMVLLRYIELQQVAGVHPTTVAELWQNDRVRSDFLSELFPASDPAVSD